MAKFRIRYRVEMEGTAIVDAEDEQAAMDEVADQWILSDLCEAADHDSVEIMDAEPMDGSDG